MSDFNHVTAPAQYVEAKGIRFAYRRFGKKGGVPLVFNQHFTGTMDHWGSEVTDGLAETREVILFNNAGVSSSTGNVPPTFEEMAANAIVFIRALDLKVVDVLGFSIGGMVAQEIALQAPDLVRKLILVGTGPRGGEGMATLTPEAQAIFGATYEVSDEIWLKVHFTPSEASQKAGRRFLGHFRERVIERDPEANEATAGAQMQAIGAWGVQKSGSYEYLKKITAPTLVVNGMQDVIVYTVNSYILAQNIPNAELILYPDANHGSIYQYPEQFTAHANLFLNS
jgi:pimeloyl-ACP methyl ester carboxylesterase